MLTIASTFAYYRTSMDVVKAIQHYVDKLISDVPGMKVLLLDTETVSNMTFSFLI